MYIVVSLANSPFKKKQNICCHQFNQDLCVISGCDIIFQNRKAEC